MARKLLCQALLVAALCIVAAAPFASATLGVDVSVLVSQSQYSCLKSKGYTKAIPRGWRSSGSADPNIAANIKNAQAAGLSTDIYFFPNPKGASPASQMSSALSAFKGLQYGTLWLDIEAPSMWPSSASANVQFIQSLVSTAQSAGVSVGIYSSSSQWSPITGGSTSFSSLPLWYAHYDNNPSFSDFSPFGGWSSPQAKQYAGDATECGVDVDLDYFGGASTTTSTHGTTTKGTTGGQKGTTGGQKGTTGGQKGTTGGQKGTTGGGQKGTTGGGQKGTTGGGQKGTGGGQQGTTGYSSTGQTSYSSTGQTSYSSTGQTSYSSTGQTSYSSTGQTSYSSTGQTSYSSTGQTSYSSTGQTSYSSTGGYTGYTTGGSTGGTGYSTGSTGGTGYSTSGSYTSSSSSSYSGGSGGSGSGSGSGSDSGSGSGASSGAASSGSGGSSGAASSGSSGSPYTTTYTTRA